VFPDGETGRGGIGAALTLLHADDHPWFFLAQPAARAPAITEVGSTDAHPGLTNLVLRYAGPDDTWVDVGWTVRPVRPQMTAEENDTLTAADMAERLVLAVLHAAAGAGAYRAEILRRFNAAPPSWAPSTIVENGAEHPASCARALDSRLTYALLGDQVVFVHSSGWTGSTALRRSLDRPPLPAA